MNEHEHERGHVHGECGHVHGDRGCGYDGRAWYDLVVRGYGNAVVANDCAFRYDPHGNDDKQAGTRWE